MELQRVLAHDTRKAMEKVYELYGENAMVVSNKKAQNQTELIVAIDLANQAMDALNDTGITPTPRKAASELPKFDSVLEAHVFGQPVSKEPPAVEETKTSAANGDRISPFERGVAINPNFSEEANSNVFRDDNQNLRAREIVDIVKQELANMRKEFKLSQQVDAWSGTLAVSDEMRPLMEAFNETGMPVSLRALMTDIINKHSDMISALTEIAAFIGDGIRSIDLLENMSGIHLIAGSSGAGKSLNFKSRAGTDAAQYFTTK